jgi:hypothetical protein
VNGRKFPFTLKKIKSKNKKEFSGKKKKLVFPPGPALAFSE